MAKVNSSSSAKEGIREKKLAKGSIKPLGILQNPNQYKIDIYVNGSKEGLMIRFSWLGMTGVRNGKEN